MGKEIFVQCSQVNDCLEVNGTTEAFTSCKYRLPHIPENESYQSDCPVNPETGSACTPIPNYNGEELSICCNAGWCHVETCNHKIPHFHVNIFENICPTIENTYCVTYEGRWEMPSKRWLIPPRIEKDNKKMKKKPEVNASFSLVHIKGDRVTIKTETHYKVFRSTGKFLQVSQGMLRDSNEPGQCLMNPEAWTWCELLKEREIHK